MKVIQYYEGMEIVPPCLVLGMPNEVYHSWPDSISNSGLNLIARSPAHFQYREASKGSRAMEIGTAFHTALLEPEIFAKRYVLLRDVTARTASEYKAAAKVHGGENVLTGPEADSIVAMVESVYANKHIAPWLRSDGYREASLFVNDPTTGLLVRVRYDFITKSGHAFDLKKTQDARADKFSKSIYDYRYHSQAALYSDAWSWATDNVLESFRFIAVEEKLPNASMMYRLDETALADGWQLYRDALDTYAECVARDEWPAYEATDDDVISLPDWRLRQIENEMDVELGDME